MRFAGVSGGGSHQMAMSAIGRELQKKGHEFLLLDTSFQAKQLQLSDIPFHVIGGNRIDPVQQYYGRANAGGVSISATLEFLKGMADLLCTELPPVLRSERIDFVLADQEQPGA